MLIFFTSVKRWLGTEGFLIAARVFSVTAAVGAAFASCFGLSGVVRGAAAPGLLRVGMCAASAVGGCLAWGMWLGVHRLYAEPLPDSSLGVSFTRAPPTLDPE